MLFFFLLLLLSLGQALFFFVLTCKKFQEMYGVRKKDEKKIKKGTVLGKC